MRRFRKNAGISLLATFLAAVLCFATGCNGKKDLPDGTGYQTITNGRCDDGDDTNGGPTQYAPRDANRSCTDGSTKANSQPVDFRETAGVAIARVGSHAHRLAEATSQNKAKSTLQVHQKQTLQWTIDTFIDSELTGGTGKVQALVFIFDSNGRAVGNSAQYTYDLVMNPQNPTKQIDVKLNNAPKTTILNPGSFHDQEPGATAAISLDPGIYTIQLELNIFAQADGGSSVTARSVVKFQ